MASFVQVVDFLIYFLFMLVEFLTLLSDVQSCDW